MKQGFNEKESRIKAKKKVRKLKVFYIHLLGYLVFAALIFYNFYILDQNYQHKDRIIWLNLTTLVGWTVFIALHAWTVFKGRLLFKKSWEEKKIQEILDEEQEVETTMWE